MVIILSFYLKLKMVVPKIFNEISSKGLRKKIKLIKPKAILINGYSHSLFIFAFIWAKYFKIPIIFRGETTDYSLKRNKFKEFLRDKYLSHLYKQCAKILYIGENSYKHYKRLNVDEKKLIFSPYSVDENIFKPKISNDDLISKQLRHNLNIDNNQIVIIYSGKISYRKGVDLIVDCLNYLPNNLLNKIVLIFLGSGNMEDKIKLLLNNYKNIRYHFLGFKNQSEITNFYNAADLLVLPSRYSETWGLVVNEAMHHGLPCIVSDNVGCANDLILEGKTGLIFKSNSSESLGKSIITLVSSFKTNNYNKHCKEHVKNYSIEKSAEGIAKAYYELV